MKTEEIQRTTASHDPLAVSRALQDLTPVSCTIVDRRGKPVPLSAAGYVLRFGSAYHLRVLSPFPEDELHEITVVNAPPFLSVGPEMREVDEQGRTVRSLPLKVSLDWWSLWSHLHRFGLGINADELEIVQRFRPGLFREASPFLCPVVARPRWTTLFVLVLIAVLGVLLHKTLGHLFALDTPESLRAFWESMLRWDSWLAVLGVTFGLWAFVTFLNICFLYQRVRELRQHYEEAYPSTDSR